jgi:hypothetical protein
MTDHKGREKKDGTGQSQSSLVSSLLPSLGMPAHIKSDEEVKQVGAAF